MSSYERGYLQQLNYLDQHCIHIYTSIKLLHLSIHRSYGHTFLWEAWHAVLFLKALTIFVFVLLFWMCVGLWKMMVELKGDKR